MTCDISSATPLISQGGFQRVKGSVSQPPTSNKNDWLYVKTLVNFHLLEDFESVVRICFLQIEKILKTKKVRDTFRIFLNFFEIEKFRSRKFSFSYNFQWKFWKFWDRNFSKIFDLKIFHFHTNSNENFQKNRKLFDLKNLKKFEKLL